MVRLLRNIFICLFIIGIIIAIPDSNSEGIDKIFDLFVGAWLSKLVFFPMLILIIADEIIDVIENKNNQAKQNNTQYNLNMQYDNTNKRYEGYFDEKGEFHYKNGFFDNNGIWHDYDNVR